MDREIIELMHILPVVFRNVGGECLTPEPRMAN